MNTRAASPQAQPSYAGEDPAPEFPEGLDWINTGGKPLSIEGLRGKVILLDFWTFGCINCIHIIPDLKKLEAKYGDALAVIGVHSPKFDHEKKTSAVRKITMRYDLEHAVVNDRDMRIWRSYGARGWPHLALIDPEGRLIGAVSGEGHYDLLDRVIGGAIRQFEKEGKINRAPVALVLEKSLLKDSKLLFPGRVLADGVSKRLFIADTNHDRIVVTDLDGEVTAVIGCGTAGLADGDFKAAEFFRPQGLALASKDTLYVADTKNHVIRKVDLAAEKVSTVAGVGRQVYQTSDSGPAATTGMNSPWGLLYHDGLLYIAMAGQHQLWIYDPAQQELREYAGSRREELKDGRLLSAGLNQPSGLATDGEYIYVADSEASAIRAADIDPDGKLDTIVGQGLFAFGDIDGRGDKVRLQHPKDLVWWEGSLLVADTYNSKIKRINPATRESRTLIGSEAELDEPGGVSLLGDTLFIADTNRHRVVTFDLPKGEAKALAIRDPQGLLESEKPDNSL
ncbi:MAG: redoxin domain-containing protein [Gammaproteobacteria bacterium]|nr:redoxin domain-containing protein [Gammaproteobacteria bacterium]